MKTLVSRHDPIVGAFRELIETPDPSGRRLLLDGAHLVRDAAAAGLEFELAAVSTAELSVDGEPSALTEQLRRDGVEVLTVTEEVLGAMSPVRTPSGIVAIVRRPAAALVDICQQREGLLLIVIDVQDPGNVGSLIRAAEAGGVSGVIVCGASASPFGWKALRGSMGSTLRLPVGTGVSVEAALTCLKKFDTRTIATVATGGDDPDAIDWTGRAALLVGGEGAGLSADIVHACDARVTIPMTPPVESLNVAAAGAVLIYAARRQRVAR